MRTRTVVSIRQAFAHERLILKLKAHGIDGLVCNWITHGLLISSNEYVSMANTLNGNQHRVASHRDNSVSYFH